MNIYLKDNSALISLFLNIIIKNGRSKFISKLS